MDIYLHSNIVQNMFLASKYQTKFIETVPISLAQH